MAFQDLMLKGNQTIGTEDVSDQVIAFKIVGKRAVVTRPATYGRRSSVSGGDDTYEVEIQYLQDIDAEALTMLFWEALAVNPGTLEMSGTMREEVVSATNPKFTFTALITGSAIGGKVDEYGVDTQTFPLLDRPVAVTAP